jgi:hypothetical protein
LAEIEGIRALKAARLAAARGNGRLQCRCRPC